VSASKYSVIIHVRLTHFPDAAAAAEDPPPDAAAAAEEPPVEELADEADEDMVVLGLLDERYGGWVYVWESIVWRRPVEGFGFYIELYRCALLRRVGYDVQDAMRSKG
jgi:hypothetical protein